MDEAEKLRLKIIHLHDQAAAQDEQHEAALRRIAAIPSALEIAARYFENPREGRHG